MKIAIANSQIIVGTFPKTALSLVVQWMEIHRAEIEEAWLLALGNNPFAQIEPLI